MDNKSAMEERKHAGKLVDHSTIHLNEMSCVEMDGFMSVRGHL
jgi:hypothetical protein